MTLIEPGGFATDWRGKSAVWTDALPPYVAQHEVRKQRSPSGAPQGDPAATAQAILTIVDAPAPPLRLFLGAAPLGIVRATYEQRLKTWEQWDEVARAAQGS